MLDGFELSEFSHAGETRPVYRRGQGPGVLVMHEVPGITPAVASFARRVADAGFSVAMPVLFGKPGKPFGYLYIVGQLTRICIRREFHILASRASSPITDWLRALSRSLHEELGGKGIGAIGMCITGNFALSLMVDPWLMAPVLSQPSNPIGLSHKMRSALHISDDELAQVKKRVSQGVPVLGMRFTADILCPGARFERLRQELGPGFEGIEIDSSRGNPHKIWRLAHSVVTEDLVDEEGHPTRRALERVLEFFDQQLRGPGAVKESRP